MKISTFWGDLTNVWANKEPLPFHCVTALVVPLPTNLRTTLITFTVFCGKTSMSFDMAEPMYRINTTHSPPFKPKESNWFWVFTKTNDIHYFVVS